MLDASRSPELTTAPANGRPQDTTPGPTARVIAAAARVSAGHYRPLPVVLAEGQGCWVTDLEGRRYLDLVGGFSALNHGHRHPRLIAAMQRQLGRLTLSSHVAHNEHVGPLGQELVRLTGLDRVLLMNTGAEAVPSVSRLLTTVAWRAGGETCYALEGSIFMGGAIVQWLRDGLGLIRRAADVEALAASVPDSGGVVLVPAFTGLGAPYWDAYARGTLLGLTRGTGAGHIARAALEAIALQTADLVAAMRGDGAAPLTELRVDGGAAANDLLMQMQADLLGVPVVRPKMLETTALGAAYLAGIGTGVWSGPDEVAAHWRADRRFEPAMPAGQREATLARWRRAVDRARAWVDA